MHATSPSTLRRRHAQGFSLIELLLVIVMIGVLAALVMPKILVDNAQVDTATRTFGMSLMVAQREAVARQHNVLLVFDTSAHTITTVWDANNNAKVDAGEKTRPFLIPERVVLGRPASVSALGTASAGVPVTLKSGDRPMLVLQRNGSIDRGVTLYLSTIASMAGSPRAEARAVVLARATARPDWYAWTGSAWRRAQ
jgi:prepilin-type N-terminal cleavage/methylation domain-containing protein